VSYIPSYNEHLNLYNRVDIALDTFPYNGTTTTCEALWMGVPVVTLAGESHRSRVGVSILKSIGLDELITDNTDAYVTKVLALAGDVEALVKLSVTIRDKVKHSPLTDAEQFTRTLEEAYRDIWQKWCAQALGTNAS
jgi:predicted O-linked N-acetylglucosamine transferase (SPINDLY family)